MGRDEQLEEIEVLESIFPDEFTRLADDAFRIAIRLDLPDDVVAAAAAESGGGSGGGGVDDDDDGGDSAAPVMVLTVKFPEAYPDTAPLLELAPPSPPRPPHPFFSVADDREALLAGLHETVEENLGMAMVFTLVSALKDAAEQLVLGRHEAAARVREEAARAAEREENKKFHGTPVTPETFVRWQTAFLQEMAEKRRREEEQLAAELAKKGRGGGGGSGPAGAGGTARLTGRQLWEQGLAGKGDDDVDDDADDAPADDVQKLKIAA